MVKQSWSVHLPVFGLTGFVKFKLSLQLSKIDLAKLRSSRTGSAIPGHGVQKASEHVARPLDILPRLSVLWKLQGRFKKKHLVIINLQD